MDTSMIQSAEPVTVTPKNPPKQRLTVMLKWSALFISTKYESYQLLGQ